MSGSGTLQVKEKNYQKGLKMAKSTSPKDKIGTTAHLIETTGHHLAHTIRHSKQLKKSKTKKQREFNHEHLHTHLKGAAEHVQKLVDHLKDNYPQEAKELQTLEQSVPHSQANVDKIVKAAGKMMRRQ